MTAHHLDIPTTHQESSEWKPITTKSNPIQQKSRYKYQKPVSSHRKYKYKRDIDPNDNIADKNDSNTLKISNRMRRQFPFTGGGGGPTATEEPIIEEEDLFDLEFDVRNLKFASRQSQLFFSVRNFYVLTYLRFALYIPDFDPESG